jgi:predicted negative regulator of RcsB-dependent stress response
VDKLTRKELKSDKFAIEVQHSVEVVSEYRKQIIQLGVPAVIIAIIIVVVVSYRSYQHNARQEALHAAMDIQNSTVGPSQSQYVVTYPTEQARETAVLKTWNDLAAKYPGSQEAGIAEFFLGTNASDNGNLAAAAKYFQAAVDMSDKEYASEAKLSLAQVYAGEGKVNEGVNLIQSVIDHPTVMVSKDAATLALADLIKDSNPQRAHQLVDPLRTSTRSSVSQAAISLEASIGKR